MITKLIIILLFLTFIVGSTIVSDFQIPGYYRLIWGFIMFISLCLILLIRKPTKTS